MLKYKGFQQYTGMPLKIMPDLPVYGKTRTNRAKERFRKVKKNENNYSKKLSFFNFKDLIFYKHICDMYFGGYLRKL